MAGLASPGYKPPTRPPARPPQTGSYQQTAGGQVYIPSPEENAEAQRQADVRRQTQRDAWDENAVIDAARDADRDYADANQRYYDQRSDRREGIAAMQALMQMEDFGGSGGGGGGSGGGGGGGGGWTPAADTASYGRAKDNTGLALRSSVKGLDEEMNARGIFGSGIHGDQIEELMGKGLGELAETDRQLAEGSARRGYESAEARAAREWQSGENARDRAAQKTNSRLDALLRLYGMVY